MNSSVRKLTEAAILSAAFIVVTLFALSTGLGYGLYLDFIVPIIFALIYFRCELKYTILCGITSISLILFVLGNFVAAVLVSQGFVLGLLSGYLLHRSSYIFDDLYIGAILGVVFMVFVDIYARNIIGYSFMQEFKGYIDYFVNNPQILGGVSIDSSTLNLEVIYYLLIATFPFGMVTCIYFVSLMCAKRLKILNANAKKKYFMMRSLKAYGTFIDIRKEYFYTGIIYIILIEVFMKTNINLSNVYLKTILVCIQYISYYFVFRETHILIGNYINFKLKKKSLNLLYFFVTLILLVNLFKITILVYCIIAILMDKKFTLRERQKYIIDTAIDKLVNESKN